MPEQLRKWPGLYNAGSKEPIPAGVMDQVELKQNTEVTVWSKQVGNDQILFHGHGRSQREYAEGFVGLDLVASGNGSGTAGEAIYGEVILAITDSDQKRVLASTTLDTLSQLADALDQERTARIVEMAMAPYANPGRHLEVRVNADPSSDGVEIDPADSSGNLYYTRVSN